MPCGGSIALELHICSPYLRGTSKHLNSTQHELRVSRNRSLICSGSFGSATCTAAIPCRVTQPLNAGSAWLNGYLGIAGSQCGGLGVRDEAGKNAEHKEVAHLQRVLHTAISL